MELNHTNGAVGGVDMQAKGVFDRVGFKQVKGKLLEGIKYFATAIAFGDDLGGNTCGGGKVSRHWREGNTKFCEESWRD